MRAPLATELLDLCDAGETATPMERAVLLLQAATDGTAAVEQWTVGQVNIGLLQLRQLLFGRELECLCDCPRCEAIAATRIDIREMLSPAVLPPDHSELTGLGVGDTPVGVRLPTAADLLALGRDPQATGAQLLERLLESSKLSPSADAATPQLAERAAAQLARRDPLAHFELVVDCPSCAHRWTVPFHAIDILWTEITALAEQLTHEVARLAQAFGWCERDILQMSARRRQRYIERFCP